MGNSIIYSPGPTRRCQVPALLPWKELVAPPIERLIAKLCSRRTALPCGQGLRSSLLPKDQEFPPLRGRREQLGACSPFLPQQEPNSPSAERRGTPSPCGWLPVPHLRSLLGRASLSPLPTRLQGAAGKTAIFCLATPSPPWGRGRGNPHRHLQSPPAPGKETDVVRPSRVTRRHPLPGQGEGHLSSADVNWRAAQTLPPPAAITSETKTSPSPSRAPPLFVSSTRSTLGCSGLLVGGEGCRPVKPRDEFS
nr:serine/arginine repetitive matrix protein 1-like [Odocoileus virginianus texanus]